MSGPPAQQLTALTANVFNPPRGDQGCAEEEAQSPQLSDCRADFAIPMSTVLTTGIGYMGSQARQALDLTGAPCSLQRVSMGHERHVLILPFCF